MKSQQNVEAEFGINDIVPIAAAIIVAGIFIGYGLKITGDMRTTFTTNVEGCNSTTKAMCGHDYNATVDAGTGVSKVSGQLPTIGLVAAAVIVIGMLGYLVTRRS